MYLKLSITTCSIFMLLASSVSAIPKMFDIIAYGGVPNEDITQAFTNAWYDACACNVSSKVMVPRGTFKMPNTVTFSGPCKAPIEVKVDGTIQGIINPSTLKQEGSWVNFEYINFFTLSGSGIFDGLGVSNPWKQDDFDAFTVSAPGESVNTDGLHISKSTNVNVINSRIGTGDDCVSLGDGNTQITVQNVNCGPGHGFSVGSLGGKKNEQPVTGFTVRNCTINSTSNGLRVKTWADAPGNISISNLLFEDITMINVKTPILIDQEYCPSKKCGNKEPSKIQISDVTFRNIKGTATLNYGHSIVLNCSKEKPCKNVRFDNVDIKYNNGSMPLATCVNVDPIEVGLMSPSCKP
ncbi:polygalacturonase-like [Neltuma alba]|uniref:polygalacturonase-like n=1 Tax=Neltuma alba TaxID=207710 RepID=UPI0010A456A9|nr:polygalacturonase-like [Prosopis alba]